MYEKNLYCPRLPLFLCRSRRGGLFPRMFFPAVSAGKAAFSPGSLQVRNNAMACGTLQVGEAPGRLLPCPERGSEVPHA